jgi:hypothetical protein
MAAKHPRNTEKESKRNRTEESERNLKGRRETPREKETEQNPNLNGRRETPRETPREKETEQNPNLKGRRGNTEKESARNTRSRCTQRKRLKRGSGIAACTCIRSRGRPATRM